MRLRIVRHAESTGNARGRWQGRDDTQLTELGRSQAGRLRDRFLAEGYRPSHLYSSPLSRTYETARIASSNWDLPIIKWDELMETDVGVATGMTWEELEAQMPELALEFSQTRNLDLIEGAETYAQRTARALRVVDRFVSDHRNPDSVLLVSHGGIMTHIFAQLVGTSRLWGLGVSNTAIFDFTIDADRWHSEGQSRTNSDLWRINSFNDAAHLD